MNAQTRSVQCGLRSVAIGQRLEKVTAHHPEHVDLTLRCAIDHLGCRPSGRLRNREPPYLLPPGCCVRIDFRHAADLGTTLNTGMPANRHEAAVLAKKTSRQTDV